MKVVLFCGGYGMRMRNGASDDVPKPMAMVGPRPLIWHVMRYYAHFGHTEFILCLGYGAHHIKDFFLNYEETTSNDFVLRRGETELLSTDISDWTITFVQTGIESPIGERLRRVRHLLDGDEMFLANYADVLTDAPLPDMIERFQRSDAVVSLLAAPMQSTHHVVDIDDDGTISRIKPVHELEQWENGGYFVLRPSIFDVLGAGEDLVEDALRRLVPGRGVIAFPHKGFWTAADTVKDRILLEERYNCANCPWMVWDPERSGVLPTYSSEARC
jgi:glucose-1-phosphate cytidylyltransferase